MTMIGTHTEIVLNKLTKPELVQRLLKTEATLGSQITDLSKKIKDTRGSSKQKGSAEKTSNIPDETLWRLLAFQILLIIVSLKKRCVVSSKTLVSKLTNGMFKPVIA